MSRPVGPIGEWACMTCDADNWRNRTYCAECGEPRVPEAEQEEQEESTNP